MVVSSSVKKPPRIFYSWSDFDSDILSVVKQIDDSLWIPDYIVGVKRGGLIPAIKLSHCFNKPMIMMSCQLRDSKDTEVRLYEVEEISTDKKILIVDDICDSGVTLSKIILQFYVNGFSIDNVRTCSLFYNSEQNFIVDYTARNWNRSTNKEWIVFPWEV
jgi:hypoxanthine phosphoribosyltransferase